MDSDQLICVGAIIGAFGVKGELRVKSFCAEPSDLDKYKPLYSKDGKQTFELKITRPIKGGFAARIKGIQYKDQADALKAVGLYATRDVLPELIDDEFYHSDLVGVQAIDTGGKTIGEIMAIHNYGAGDILEISDNETKKTILLPFTQENVPTIDLEKQRVIIDLPDGMAGQN